MNLLTAKQVAADLQTSVHTLANWRVDGVGPVYARIGGRVRYREVDVQNWVESQLRRTTDAPQEKRRKLALPLRAGRSYSGNTDLVATGRNKTAALLVEAKARELVKNGRAHELRLTVMTVSPFSEAALALLTWADGEYRDHPNSAKRLRTSFASLSRFSQLGPRESRPRYLTIRKGRSPAARRRLKLTAESRGICARRIGSAPGRWLFPGKLPGSRLAKLNGPHGRVLDDLAVCKCSHRRIAHKKEACACGCTAFSEVSRLAFVIYDFPAYVRYQSGRIRHGGGDPGEDSWPRRSAQRYEIYPRPPGSPGSRDGPV